MPQPASMIRPATRATSSCLAMGIAPAGSVSTVITLPIAQQAMAPHEPKERGGRWLHALQDLVCTFKLCRISLPCREAAAEGCRTIIGGSRIARIEGRQLAGHFVAPASGDAIIPHNLDSGQVPIDCLQGALQSLAPPESMLGRPWRLHDGKLVVTGSW